MKINSLIASTFPSISIFDSCLSMRSKRCWGNSGLTPIAFSTASGNFAGCAQANEIMGVFFDTTSSSLAALAASRP